MRNCDSEERCGREKVRLASVDYVRRAIQQRDICWRAVLKGCRTTSHVMYLVNGCDLRRTSQRFGVWQDPSGHVYPRRVCKVASDLREVLRLNLPSREFFQKRQGCGEARTVHIGMCIFTELPNWGSPLRCRALETFQNDHVTLDLQRASIRVLLVKKPDHESGNGDLWFQSSVTSDVRPANHVASVVLLVLDVYPCLS